MGCSGAMKLNALLPAVLDKAFREGIAEFDHNFRAKVCAQIHLETADRERYWVFTPLRIQRWR